MAASRRQRRKSRLGNLNASSIVEVQLDPYSAPIFLNAETAENILEDRMNTKSGGRRTRRARRHRRHSRKN